MCKLSVLVQPESKDVLTSNDLHLIDGTEAREVITQALLCHSLVEIAEVDVPSRAVLLHSCQNTRRNRARFATRDQNGDGRPAD